MVSFFFFKFWEDLMLHFLFIEHKKLLFDKNYSHAWSVLDMGYISFWDCRCPLEIVKKKRKYMHIRLIYINQSLV